MKEQAKDSSYHTNNFITGDIWAGKASPMLFISLTARHIIQIHATMLKTFSSHNSTAACETWLKYDKHSCTVRWCVWRHKSAWPLVSTGCMYSAVRTRATHRPIYTVDRVVFFSCQGWWRVNKEAVQTRETHNLLFAYDAWIRLYDILSVLIYSLFSNSNLLKRFAQSKKKWYQCDPNFPCKVDFAV